MIQSVFPQLLPGDCTVLRKTRLLALNMDNTITYADAGVDIEKANRTKQRIKYLAHKTFNKAFSARSAASAACFKSTRRSIHDPVLVSSVDGVGTKLKIAFEMNLHHTVGADLVNHCVNDIAVQGATPLFFMDYLATGSSNRRSRRRSSAGLAEACKHNGCALIGGETAEMPGFYRDGEYDLAGFIVGVVEREKIITGKDVKVGDVLIGLPSTGLHTNGYSLARKLLFEVAQYTPETYVNEIKDKAGAALMKQHKSYWPIIATHGRRRGRVSAMAHITGGGITDNLPRVLPKGIGAVVEMGTWPVPPIFEHLQKLGNVAQDEMMRTFNMGIGMILVVIPRSSRKPSPSSNAPEKKATSSAASSRAIARSSTARQSQVASPKSKDKSPEPSGLLHFLMVVVITSEARDPLFAFANG